MTRSDWKWIGRHFPPIEDKRFVLGKGHYINDIVLPGMLHMATLPSPHAHAHIVRIDTHAAEPAPGVVEQAGESNLPACSMHQGSRGRQMQASLAAGLT
jgi:CO/xanthine dehydrogenase Mo-binding subunit